MKDYILKFELDPDEQLSRECPICLVKFEHNAVVIGLECSSVHIYHSHCMEKMMDNQQTNCAICRNKINPS